MNKKAISPLIGTVLLVAVVLAMILIIMPLVTRTIQKYDEDKSECERYEANVWVEGAKHLDRNLDETQSEGGCYTRKELGFKYYTFTFTTGKIRPAGLIDRCWYNKEMNVMKCDSGWDYQDVIDKFECYDFDEENVRCKEKEQEESEPTKEYNCKILSDWETIELSALPISISVDENIFIDFTNVKKDDYTIINLSKEVRRVSNNTIDLIIWSKDYEIIYNMDDYIRCKFSTIERLKDLNAEDILYDVCVEVPRIASVSTRATFNGDKHMVEVCYKKDDLYE